MALTIVTPNEETRKAEMYAEKFAEGTRIDATVPSETSAVRLLIHPTKGASYEPANLQVLLAEVDALIGVPSNLFTFTDAGRLPSLESDDDSLSG